MTMASPTAWDRMRAGELEMAIEQMRAELAEKPDFSHMMSLGIGYLWTGDYESASDHFDRVNRKYPFYGDSFYAMAGAAKWCLGDPTAAVKEWRDGLHCEFSDPSGQGISLLLLFASVVEPSLVAAADAEQVMVDRLALPQASLWPGALAKYILGRIDSNELSVQLTGRHRDETKIRHWFMGFYQGVLAYRAGDKAHYIAAMTATADASRPEWDDKRFFFSAVWNEEFFLARHEAQRRIGA